MRAKAWASTGLLIAAIGAGILLVGGALRWTEAVVGALAFAAVVPTALSKRVFARRSPLLALIAIAIVLTAIQLLPLPAALVSALQPVGAGLRSDGAALAGTSPWRALTLDEPGTLRALAGLIILFGIAVVALRASATERGRYHVVAGVGALCGLTAIVVGVHALVGATSLYGLYEPEHAGPHLLGPLLNLNHLGCLMAMGVVVCIGLAAHVRQPTWRRVLWIAIAAACGGFAVATVSRGATIALGVGGLIAVGALVGQRMTAGGATKARGDLWTSAIPIGIVAACAIVVVIYASASNVEQALGHTSFDELSAPRTKFVAWRSAMHLVQETPWVGVGRGAFEVAFTRVHPASAYLTYSHVENEYLQAVVDWGVPGAVALAAAAGWLLIIAVRRWREGALAAAALGGLAVVAVQSNVDFGLELLGLAAPATALAATLAHVPLKEVTGRPLQRAYAARGVLLIGLALAITALLSTATTSIDEDHQRLRDKPTDEELTASLTRHPLDYFGYAVAAERLARRGDRASVRMLNHALLLHPTHPGLHHFAAQLLYRGGLIEQSTIEYAAALRGVDNPVQMIGEIAALFPAKQAAAAIPVDLPSASNVLAALDAAHRPDIATAYLAHVLELHPDDPSACDALYTSAIRTGALDQISLASARCPSSVLDHPTRIQLAKMMLAAKRFDDTLHLVADVEDWTGRVDERVTAWLVRCDAYFGRADFDAAKHCLRSLDVSGYVSDAQRGELDSRMQAIDATAVLRP